MTLEIPKNSMVVISGPPATGKSALAQRIYDECPIQNKCIISFPSDLTALYIQRMQCASQGVVEQITAMNRKIIQEVYSANSRKSFIICDGCYAEAKALSGFFYQARLMKVCRPITLIKLAAMRAQQIKAIQSILAKTPEYHAPTYEELDQQNELFAEVINREFSAESFWSLREYLILDTDAIQLKFL